MIPKYTYELRIHFNDQDTKAKIGIKEEVKQCLMSWGEDTFVEGCVDDIDLDFDYDEPDLDYYEKLGGDRSPISIFRYDIEYLKDLKQKLIQRFSEQITCAEHRSESQLWQEGWKESFKPIATRLFFVYPPWEKPAANATTAKHYIEIEPGMAFGTGQHATTQLCLEAIEDLDFANLNVKVLDVGTGTGILAIAVHRLGVSNILATDIDPDAVKSARENCQTNECESIHLEQGSITSAALESPSDLVIANILFVVIKRILAEIEKATTPGGQILLSGILSEEKEELLTLCHQFGLILKKSREKNGWIAVLLEKPKDTIR